MSIAILVPVLGRPAALRPLVESVKRATSVDWTLRFLCSPEDIVATERCFDLARSDSRLAVEIVSWLPGPGDWARKINHGYRETNSEFLFLGATDLRFHEEWDLRALALAASSGAGVIGTNDLGNPVVQRGRHSTHPLVRRAYADEYGTIDERDKIVHEGYHHQWVDNELCETAKARAAWAFAFDAHVEHLHPMWHKAKMDSTYEKALSTPRQDQRLFASRRRLWAGARPARGRV